MHFSNFIEKLYQVFDFDTVQDTYPNSHGEWRENTLIVTSSRGSHELANERRHENHDVYELQKMTLKIKSPLNGTLYEF